jgi:hypothetical protein
MTTSVTAKVVAITKDDGSMSVEQLQDVLRFLDRLINGSPLDPLNHDDDSLRELAGYSGQLVSKRLLAIDTAARELRKRLIGV